MQLADCYKSLHCLHLLGVDWVELARLPQVIATFASTNTPIVISKSYPSPTISTSSCVVLRKIGTVSQMSAVEEPMCAAGRECSRGTIGNFKFRGKNGKQKKNKKQNKQNRKMWLCYLCKCWVCECQSLILTAGGSLTHKKARTASKLICATLPSVGHFS